MKAIEHITIIGMGALGIMYGEHFASAMGREAVTFLADQDRTCRYRREGVSCNGKACDFLYKSPVAAPEPAQLLLFAVKATALDAAIELARPYVNEETIIISVLNGISCEDIIREKLGIGQVIYSVAQGMDAVKLGNELTYSNKGVLCIGIPKAETDKQPALDAVVELFERSRLPHVVEKDILHRVWSKWMLNVGVNQVVMVVAGSYGTVQQPGPARDLMIAAMREVILLAEAEHIAVTEQDMNEYLALVDTLNPEGMPSMRQDGLARRYSEVELFAGTVLRKARANGIAVPVNEHLYQTITEMENGY